jgi:photosystem II stability/assembly factor-like uncharacterized protein
MQSSSTPPKAAALPSEPATTEASGLLGRFGRFGRFGRWVIVLLLALLGLASWWASGQLPHPDVFRPMSAWDVTKADWWAYPLERKAFNRPGQQRDLSGVFVRPDGSGVWAVGQNGLILYSADQGESWNVQREPAAEKASLKAVHFSNANTGLAVGENGTVLSTRDGGQSWSTRRLTESDALLTSVYLNGNQAWVVGGSGLVVNTNNTGDMYPDWSTQRGVAKSKDWIVSAANARLYGVHFDKIAANGWAVGEKGTVISTVNGGKQWKELEAAGGSKATLLGVYFNTLAKDTPSPKGWAVGTEGTLLTMNTTFGGEEIWSTEKLSTHTLNSVHFNADARRGWIVGENSTVLYTLDGGKTWLPQKPQNLEENPNSPKPWLRSVHVAESGLNGWVVGTGGTVQRTQNSGVTWTNAAAYSRYWAPWYYAVLACIALAITSLVAFAGKSSTPVKTHAKRRESALPDRVATTLQSDQPIFHKSADLLGYRAAVEALSSFIRNRETEPRVTLAITGDWGTGKSSIMRMLKTDLDTAGFRTAWFNAWHHQQEGRQLTALFNTIRQQAVPTWWGLTFFAALRARSRLIWGRGLAYQMVATGLALGLAWLLGDVLGSVFNEGFQIVWERITANFKHHVLQQNTTVGGAGSVTTGVASAAKTAPAPPLIFWWLDSPVLHWLAGIMLILFTKGFSVYGLQLLAPLRNLLGFGDKATDANGKEISGTIERYRSEFNLLCNALDGRLVVFIDDLDRCNSATVNGMLEMTNYLVDVGNCFVVLGAAINRVEPCIISPADGKYSANYARDYLRKLIHVQLPVPLAGANLKALLGESGVNAAANTAAISPKAQARWAQAKRWALPTLLLVAMLVMFDLGMKLHRIDDPSIGGRKTADGAWAAKAAAASTASAPSAGKGASVPLMGPTQTVTQPAAASSAVDPYAPPAVAAGVASSAASVSTNSRSTQPVLPWFLAITAIALAFAWRWYERNRTSVKVAVGGAVRSTDSPEFMAALRVWNSAVIQYDPTPRHMKRFYNHARLFASYEIEETTTGQQRTIEDADLVAMTALQHMSAELLPRLYERVRKAERNGENFKTALVGHMQTPHDKWSASDNMSLDLHAPNHTARACTERCVAEWAMHLATFGWSTGSEQIKRFMNRIRGAARGSVDEP